LLNDSCPGVSMISKPGIRSSASANCTTQYAESYLHTHTDTNKRMFSTNFCFLSLVSQIRKQDWF
jgi:hypothetical protein